ncbi:LPS export ABC transporter permease LptF [Allofranklinella schreckenbergeri]|uniref:Lipopolysaccharide export system permease protein LptF n=1 Tax=Allofranklinella schreckenbergeri TaxID=1076744 RepID=A0A3M6Q9D5_9BURK|nr:LPS export ABC transporter permease LptF [Allofranklinella schreckenbergeri]RMW99719.1 LPS export ABC transporter permease LptF [Allofranklinella schreckenbergeri]RRD42098.1 LptF/LptG family permease [Comamonadaceae bacterium OH3737_COT-264]
MLFDTSLRKDLSRSFLGTLTVLLMVVITLMLIRTLGQASKGAVSPSDIMLVMGYTVLGYMPIVLSLSLFVAVIGTLARMYQDSEMVIWFASGRGLAGFLPTLARFAWPLVLAIGALSLFAWPWSQAQILDLRNQFQQRSDLDRIAPGEFQVSSSGDSVFFVDRDSSSLEQARQIFFAQEKPEESSVTTARSASLVQQGGQSWVVLETGQRVEQIRGDKPALRVAEFDRYEVLLRRDPVSEAQTSIRATPSAELLARIDDPEQGNAYEAELVWRAGLALAAINYIILALALTSSNPRSGRMGHVVTALLVFVVYFNLLSLGQNWVARGRIHGGLWLALLHGGVFVLAWAWLMARNAQWTLGQWRGRARRKAAVAGGEGRA